MNTYIDLGSILELNIDKQTRLACKDAVLKSQADDIFDKVVGHIEYVANDTFSRFVFSTQYRKLVASLQQEAKLAKKMANE